MIKLPYTGWGMGEYWAAVGAIVSGSVKRGSSVAKLSRMLDSTLEEKTFILLLNSARVGIRLALEAFRSEYPNRYRVLVPAYICPAVLEAVNRAGLEPVMVDVGSDLNIRCDLVEKQLDESTLAVVVAHMYGCPAPIDRLEQVCRRKGIQLVDDAAQVLGERTSVGRFLGTHGQVGVFSFAQSKEIATGVRGSGGVLLVNDPHWINPMQQAVSHLNPPDGRIGQFLYFVTAYQLGTTGAKLAYYWERATSRVGMAKEKEFYQAALISNLDAAIALGQLVRLEVIREIRLRLADQYFKHLGDFVPEVEFPQYAAGRLLTRIVILLPADKDKIAIRKQLGQRGVPTRDGYPLSAISQNQFKKAANVVARILELPSYWTMTDIEVRHVCKTLMNVLHNC